ncbi:TNT domain-containing protein [Micromonospora purpureochromogenes]|uniref:TNT domain-containing protein n=1 Tax=Micromonospora purpureochromogenes TaxID=47872 RepID=UPI0033FAF180
MDRRRWLLALLSGAALILFPGPADQAAAPDVVARAGTHPDDGAPEAGDSGGRPGDPAGVRPGADHPQPSAGPSLCRPDLPPSAPPTTRYLDENPLLGPARLPTASPLGPLLAGYQRFGGLTESRFLARYTTGTPAGYVFPPANGFLVAPDGTPLKTRQTLLAGYRLDRFGFAGGAFLAPLGTPVSARSLAPQNLDTPPLPAPRPALPSAAPLANYHTYCVLKPFDVDSGPTAPWFAQPGLGTQFQLNPAYLPQAGANLTVQWLVDHRFLVEESLAGTAGECVTDSAPRRGGTGGGVPAVHVC